MLVRMVADGDVVDEKIGDPGNIISELYEEKDVIDDMGGNFGAVDGISVPAAVEGGVRENIEVRLLETEHMEGIITR